MRLVELEIIDTRGIRELHLKPGGGNLVVWGPNGSGKSAVIDAVDFLLTGRMRRLAGQGTAGITLGKHGPHVDSPKGHALVRGVVDLGGEGEPLELIRRLSSSSQLEFDESRISEAESALAIAACGQNILTRREILQFVTADAGTRGEQIQALLDLVAVETIRKAFTQASNRCEAELADANAGLNQARSRLAAVTGLDNPSANQILDFTNACRVALGAEPLTDPNLKQLKASISSPTSGAGALGQLNPSLIENSLKILKARISSVELARLEELQSTLQESIIKLKTESLESIQHKALVDHGLALLDDSGSCPLCGAKWEPTELRRQLEEKTRILESLDRSLKACSGEAQALAQYLSTAFEALRTLMRLSGVTEIESHLEQLKKLETRLSKVVDSLERPIEQVVTQDVHFNVKGDFKTEEVSTAISAVDAWLPVASKDIDSRVASWDSLTLLEEALTSIKESNMWVMRARRSAGAAEALVNKFREARDAVLQELYDSIKDRFVELYRAIHSPDETGFEADLHPKGAGIDFQVDFYGRGIHPPHALHSEGHQDSMGLCLFLALLEQLAGETMSLVLLDDVVMSVDTDHRRSLAKLLGSAFPSTQFIITTHDRTWANQLRAEGVVTSANTIQFYGWSLETGPRVLYEGDLWDQIEQSLGKDDVPASAHRLRRGAEEYFQSVCDALEARVRFSLGGRVDLADFVPAAMSRYRDLLKAGKAAANSWNNPDTLAEFQEIESTAKQVFARTHAEQWAINDNVHYNSWIDLSPQEFHPVLEAFQDLFELFRCSGCGTLLRVGISQGRDAALKCDCGQVSWNLVAK